MKYEIRISKYETISKFKNHNFLNKRGLGDVGAERADDGDRKPEIGDRREEIEKE